ncbi:sulfurtransferase [Halomonas mongoliensis]
MTAPELAEALDGHRPPRLLDCRARLGDPDAGHTLWWEAHLPGSVHLDLDRDLAGPPGRGGRHPLPAREAFTATLQRLGITPELPVVVYDDMGGQLAAARAWWMLACWAGHPDVRLLDGGIKAWMGAGGEVVEGDRAAPRPATGGRPIATIGGARRPGCRRRACCWWMLAAASDSAARSSPSTRWRGISPARCVAPVPTT